METVSGLVICKQPIKVQPGAPFARQKHVLQSSFQVLSSIQSPFESIFGSDSLSERFTRRFPPAKEQSFFLIF